MAVPKIGKLGARITSGRRIATLLEQTNAHLVIAGRHILRAQEAARESKTESHRIGTHSVLGYVI